MVERIGAVTKRRYEKLVDEAVAAVETITGCQFRLGEIALEIEPMNAVGVGGGGEVYNTLRLFAEDIGIEFDTLRTYRSVASRWPRQKRARGTSFTVHRTLAKLDDRFELIRNPPYCDSLGRKQWTCDAAARAAGWMPGNPQTADERVHKIHDLASDDVVAARVASDFLRRPEVAHRVVSDSTARHVINRAQIDHGRQARDVAQQRTPIIKQLAYRIQIVDLLGACSAFVAAMNRHVPSLSDQRLGGKERAAVLEQLRRVHAAAAWCETVAQTGDISMDDQLEQLLRGDGS